MASLHLGGDIITPLDKPRSVMTHFTLSSPPSHSSSSGSFSSGYKPPPVSTCLSPSLLPRPAEGVHLCADVSMYLCVLLVASLSGGLFQEEEEKEEEEQDAASVAAPSSDLQIAPVLFVRDYP